MIALSEEGRARFDAFPTLIADDLFLDSQFSAAEKAEALGASSSARDVAAALGIDEIIHERETVDTIRRALDVLSP